MGFLCPTPAHSVSLVIEWRTRRPLLPFGDATEARLALPQKFPVLSLRRLNFF